MLEQLYILPILLFSVIIHEIAHGWMALRLGDPTARDLGRLTLNPIPHIDPIGSILIPLLSLAASGRVFIAWAKPVPINPLNFAHYRRGDMLVSIVGPVSNFILSFVCTVTVIFLVKITPFFHESNTYIRDGLTFLTKMFAGGITLNIILAVFNMIPIPPLDGSHVVASMLPGTAALKFRRIGFAGIFVIILLMRWEPFSNLFYKLIGALAYPFQLLITTFV